MEAESSSSRYDKLEGMSQDGSSEPRNLPLEYLRNITNNFSDERLLGEGGFGTVYKGVLPDGGIIAVKKLNSSMPGINDRHFENEAHHLMRLKHPNVVLLVGWCSEIEKIYVQYNGKYICAEKPERLLCLEYMPKGSLRGYLSDEVSGLAWDTRYKIIEGICYGLHYLHEEWQHNAPIIHMDLKPANILLDNNMVPKIADFGLSRLFSEEKTWTCTISRDGTLGYMAPEYINKGLISTKSDTFSLGVIIIEIVTGRRDYPDHGTGISSEEYIELVLKNWRNRLEKTLDYATEIYCHQIRRCVQIGLACVKLDRSKRPTTSQIIKVLHGLESANFSDSSTSSNSAAYPEARILEAPNLRLFTLAELRSATRNFRPDTVVGEGGFGRVYKGVVEEKTMNPTRSGVRMVVAVRRQNPKSLQGIQEWQSEVKFLGRLSHPNLLRLLGCCVEDREQLLVYEFMPRGSLENHLFRKGGEPIPWNLRLRIAIGAARGLAFLHSPETNTVIYRGLKTSRILLDTNYNAKLSNFGLAKHGPTGGDSHVSTSMMGTYGYMAPEYIATGHLYVKSDVWSFGVVLLEMLTGLRVRDKGRPAQQHNLVDWAKPYLAGRGKLASLVDPRLEGQYPSKAALQVAQLTLRCLNGNPRSRPSMAEVVAALEKIDQITVSPNSAPREERRDDANAHGRDGSNGSHPSFLNVVKRFFTSTSNDIA